jgi:hypothetical protein
MEEEERSRARATGRARWHRRRTCRKELVAKEVDGVSLLDEKGVHIRLASWERIAAEVTTSSVRLGSGWSIVFFTIGEGGADDDDDDDE